VEAKIVLIKVTEMFLIVFQTVLSSTRTTYTIYI